MELPRPLRAAIDAELTGVPMDRLRGASDILSGRYRAETRDGRLHLSDDLFAKAYVAARMPATFAALRAALEEVETARPDFAPGTLLDVGAGPGTALWACVDAFPGLGGATLLEASRPIRVLGERLSGGRFAFSPDWREGTIREAADALPKADLVTLSYVLDELDAPERARLVSRLWERTDGILLIVEPGTPAGWARILEARRALIEAGARIAAPCAHEDACPVAAPDWCHFARRVARSRVHLGTKGAEVPWEDEKFSYVAASRLAPAERRPRVLAPPEAGSGKVALKLCEPDGTLRRRLVTKREGDAFRRARRTDWGERVEV